MRTAILRARWRRRPSHILGVAAMAGALWSGPSAAHAVAPIVPIEEHYPMSQDALDKLGPVMGEIGQALAEIADGDPEGVFLYVEFGPGWVRPSVFKDEGSVVRSLDTGLDLDNLLFDAWYTAPEGKRWSVLEYGIKGGKFSVAFEYPEEVDVESSFDANRRRAALLAYYGDKPVVYPPPPHGAFELKP